MPEKQRRPMTVRERHALLALHGIKLADIARATGRSQKTVSTVVNSYPIKKSRPIQEWIAQHTNKTYEQIWGTIKPGRKPREKGQGDHMTTVPKNDTACK